MKTRSSTPRHTFTRRWLFRAAALLIGVVPLLALEILLALCGWGESATKEDPFVGFSEVHPLFVLNEDQSQYEIATDRLGYFRPDSFAKEKAEDEYRIFCLGGSTVQGRPFATETSFTTWLQIALNETDPSRDWNVVNCGGVSYASYRLVNILDEVLRYQPDMIVLYTGHNEFLEDRTYAHIKHLPAVVAVPGAWISKLRTYGVLQSAYRRIRGQERDPELRGRPVMKSEVDAMLEYRGGLEKYHRDDRWHRDVMAHFRHNLEKMVDAASGQGVPLLLANPVCNLRDCGPFKTEHRVDITPEELTQWKRLFLDAGEHLATNASKATDLLEQARDIDDQHAGLHYALAKCYDTQGRMAEAKASYIRAKEADICPIRILEPMNRAILEIAASSDAHLVDVRTLFEKVSEHGIPGGYRMIDHVHPSIAGHQLIAKLFLDHLIHLDIAKPVPEAKQKATAAMNAHYNSLDDLYFAEGQERLEMLQGWTQGKASQEPGGSTILKPAE